MTENKNSLIENFIKLTAIIPILGIVLYSLGWKYWSSYYESFGIDQSLISLSIEKVIVTTWALLLGTLLVTNAIIVDFIENKNKDKIHLLTTIFIILLTITISFIDQIEGISAILILLSCIIVFVIAAVLENKGKINIGYISKTNYLILMFVVIYFAGNYFYTLRGQREAKVFKEEYSEKIEIVLEDGTKILGSLITNMNAKYFVLTENDKCIKVVVIVNEEKVRQVNVIDYYIR